MKCLICTLATAAMILMSSCALKEPRYALGDIVKYRVKTFYKNVCNGNAMIKNYYIKSNEIIYTVLTEDSCPINYIYEKSIIK